MKEQHCLLHPARRYPRKWWDWWLTATQANQIDKSRWILCDTFVRGKMRFHVWTKVEATSYYDSRHAISHLRMHLEQGYGS